MKYLIITEADWQNLRDEVLSLAECYLKAFGEPSKHTDWLHNGDVCRLLGISKRTLHNITVTQVCCPSHRSGISAITNERTWSDYSA